MYSKDLMLWREVLKNAYRAAENGEVPIGAIVVDNEKNTIVSKGWNQVNLLHDPTAHAEMLAITAATNANQTRHLSSYTIMVSLEPCIMCAGAIHWAQVKRVQYLLPDEKFGAISHHSIKRSKKDQWECIAERPWVDPEIQAIALEYKTFLIDYFAQLRREA